MRKATPESKNSGGPEVVRFEAQLLQGPDSKTGSWALNVPKEVSKKLHGMDKVEGTINGHPFRAPLDRKDAGGLLLRVNKAMREGAGADVGDTVNLAVLGPEPEPTVPADLRGPLGASPDATGLWHELPSLAQRDWLRWIEMAKTPETRARRITRTVEQLSEGKRRPCCVNVYEYMLCRVEEE